jgi:hypothetical protein
MGRPVIPEHYGGQVRLRWNTVTRPSRRRRWRVGDRREPVQRLDAVLAAASIAHETVFGLQGEAILRGVPDARTRHLVEETARLTLTDLPRLASTARELQALWDDQAGLAPSEADDTLRRLKPELGRIAPEPEQLLARQREIALELRGLARAGNKSGRRESVSKTVGGRQVPRGFKSRPLR